MQLSAASPAIPAQSSAVQPARPLDTSSRRRNRRSYLLGYATRTRASRFRIR